MYVSNVTCGVVSCRAVLTMTKNIPMKTMYITHRRKYNLGRRDENGLFHQLVCTTIDYMAGKISG